MLGERITGLGGACVMTASDVRYRIRSGLHRGRKAEATRAGSYAGSITSSGVS